MADDHEDHSWILDDELAALFSSPKKPRHSGGTSPLIILKPRHSGGISPDSPPMILKSPDILEASLLLKSPTTIK